MTRAPWDRIIRRVRHLVRASEHDGDRLRNSTSELVRQPHSTHGARWQCSSVTRSRRPTRPPAIDDPGPDGRRPASRCGAALWCSAAPEGSGRGEHCRATLRVPKKSAGGGGSGSAIWRSPGSARPRPPAASAPIGTTKKALDLMCRRFATPCSHSADRASRSGVIRGHIGQSHRMEQTRLLTLKTTSMMNTSTSIARRTMTAVEVVAARVATTVIDQPRSSCSTTTATPKRLAARGDLRARPHAPPHQQSRRSACRKSHAAAKITRATDPRES